MGKYVDATRFIDDGSLFTLIFGGRSNGKSYSVKDLCLRDAIENGNEFVLLRRYDADIKPKMIQRYFEDYDVSALTDGEADLITGFGGEIFLTAITDDYKYKRIRRVGHSMWLGGFEHYKSAQFPKVTNIIFEEFFTKGRYLTDEPAFLQSIVSTVFRDRKGKIWLIGNPDTKLNPIIADWNLTKKIGHMKIGEEKSFLVGENKHKLTAYRCAEKNESKTTFRKKYNVDDGLWDFDNHNKMCYNKDEYIKLFSIRYDSGNELSFMMHFCVLNDTGKNFLFVYPAIEKSSFDFRLSINDTTFNAFEIWNNWHCSDLSEKIFMLIKTNNIVFSSDSCGTDFFQCLRMDKLI